MERTHRYLPTDITELILLKLPSKSLLRFQTLSKAHMTMIGQPDFIRKQLEQSRKNNNNLYYFLVTPDSSGFCLAEFADREFRIEKAVVRNKLPLGQRHFPLCSCDDNVLLIHSSEREYILWNPINHSQRGIPSPSRDFPGYLGICFDQTEDDYKVILFFDQTYMVHSCKSGTWGAAKRYEEHTLLMGAAFCHPSVLFEGKIYVVGYKSHEKAWRILYFDSTYDGVKEIEGPKDECCCSNPSLVNMRGRLCLYGYTNAKDDYVMQFWMLLQAGTSSSSTSWEKTICIDKIGSTHLGVWRQCLSYLIEDDIVICSRDGNYIVCNTTLENRRLVIIRYFKAPMERPWTCFPLPLVLSLGSFLTVHA